MTAPAPARAVHVVIAPDKFKGSLSAHDVAQAIADGFTQGFDESSPTDRTPSLVTTLIPLADGGEGTVDAALTAGWRGVEVEVPGPTGEPLLAVFARQDRGGRSSALIELAQASGLQRLPAGVRAPLTATTRGVGMMVLAAVEDGAREIVLAVGGSASTDGGAGLLVALGARLTDAAGDDLIDGGAGLAHLDRVDLSGLDPRLADVAWVLATDVDSPLLGELGAAAVFGPQKGATSEDVRVLEVGLTRFADVLAAATGRDAREEAGAGAAGGTGLVALTVLGAVRRSGVEVVLDITQFDRRSAGADLIITGEGSFDRQSLAGKTPVGVAAAARSRAIPVVAVSGRREVSEREWRHAGFTDARALTDVEPNLDTCMTHAATLLPRLARHMGREFLASHVLAHQKVSGHL